METSDADLETVITRELRILDPECRADRDCLEDLLHPEFREHGTSGRVWSRNEILTELPLEPGFDGEAIDLRADHLSPDVILLTFVTVTPSRTSLRSSVWVRSEDGRWQLRFHQGTPIDRTDGS